MISIFQFSISDLKEWKLYQELQIGGIIIFPI